MDSKVNNEPIKKKNSIVSNDVIQQDRNAVLTRINYFAKQREKLFSKKDFKKFLATDRFMQFVEEANELRDVDRNSVLYEATIIMDKKEPKNIVEKVKAENDKPEKEESDDVKEKASVLEEVLKNAILAGDGIYKAVKNKQDSGDDDNDEEKDADGIIGAIKDSNAIQTLEQVSSIATPIVGTVSLLLAKGINQMNAEDLNKDNKFLKTVGGVGLELRKFLQTVKPGNGVISGDVGGMLEKVFSPVKDIIDATEPIQDALAPWINQIEQEQLQDQQALYGHVTFQSSKWVNVDQMWELEKNIALKYRQPKNIIRNINEIGEIPSDEQEAEIEDTEPIKADSDNHAQAKEDSNEVKESVAQSMCFEKMHTTMTKKDCLNQLKKNLEEVAKITYYEETEDSNQEPKRKKLSEKEENKLYEVFHNLNYLYFQYNHLCTLSTDPSNNMEDSEYESNPKSLRLTKNGSDMFFQIGKFLQDGFTSRETSLEVEDQEYEEARKEYLNTREETNKAFMAYGMENFFTQEKESVDKNAAEGKNEEKTEAKAAEKKTKSDVSNDIFNIGSDFLIRTTDMTYAEETKAEWNPMKKDGDQTGVPDTLKSVQNKWKITPSEILLSPELLVDESAEKPSGLQELKNKIESNRKYENDLYQSVIEQKKTEITKKYENLINTEETNFNAVIRDYQHQIDKAQEKVNNYPIDAKKENALKTYKERLLQFNKTASNFSGETQRIMEKCLNKGGDSTQKKLSDEEKAAIRAEFMEVKGGADCGNRITELQRGEAALKAAITASDKKISDLDESIIRKQCEKESDLVEKTKITNKIADNAEKLNKLYRFTNTSNDNFQLTDEVENLLKDSGKAQIERLKEERKKLEEAANESQVKLTSIHVGEDGEENYAIFKMGNILNKYYLECEKLKEALKEKPDDDTLGLIETEKELKKKQREKATEKFMGFVQEVELFNYSSKYLMPQKRTETASENGQKEKREGINQENTEVSNNSEMLDIKPEEYREYFQKPENIGTVVDKVLAFNVHTSNFRRIMKASSFSNEHTQDYNSVSKKCRTILDNIDGIIHRYNEEAREFVGTTDGFVKSRQAYQDAAGDILSTARGEMKKLHEENQKLEKDAENVKSLNESEKNKIQEDINELSAQREKAQTEKNSLEAELKYMSTAKDLLTERNALDAAMNNDSGYQARNELEQKKSVLDKQRKDLNTKKDNLNAEKDKELSEVEQNLDLAIKKKHENRLEVLKTAEGKVDKILEGARTLKESEKALSDAAEKFGKAKKVYDQKYEEINRQRERNRRNNENSWNEQMNSVLERINHSDKKIGKDSSKYVALVDAIRKFVGNKGERSKWEVWHYDTLKYKEAKPLATTNEKLIYDQKDSDKWRNATAELQQALKTYIEARTRGDGKNKFTKLGQQRLDAVISLQRILNERGKMLENYEAETAKIETMKKKLDPKYVVEPLVTYKLKKNKGLPITDNTGKMISLLGGQKAADQLGISVAVNPAQKKVPKGEAANHKKEGPAKKQEDKENKQRSKENKENKVVDKKKGGKAMGGPN